MVILRLRESKGSRYGAMRQNCGNCYAEVGHFPKMWCDLILMGYQTSLGLYPSHILSRAPHSLRSSAADVIPSFPRTRLCFGWRPSPGRTMSYRAEVERWRRLNMGQCSGFPPRTVVLTDHRERVLRIVSRSNGFAVILSRSVHYYEYGLHEEVDSSSSDDMEVESGFWLHKKGDWQTCLNDRGEQLQPSSSKDID